MTVCVRRYIYAICGGDSSDEGEGEGKGVGKGKGKGACEDERLRKGEGAMCP